MSAMSRKITALVLTAGLFLSTGSQSSAHHSFAAEFDAQNCRDFTGTLTEIDWQSPHAYFYVDVANADGNIENWSFQTYALITLRRSGTERQLFIDNIGKEVWVRACLARNGRERYAAAGTLRFAADGVLRQVGQIQN
jgi:WD40 repeat protein